MNMDLSIIIVSYNTKRDLKSCLTSVFKHTKGFSFEVIVIDNDSRDGSPEMIKKDFRKVKLMAIKKNIGFGKANNLGAAKAKGKYLLFLNPDTLMETNAIKDSLDQAKKTTNLGAFSCRLLFADGTTQPTGGYFPNLFRLFAWHTALDELPLLKNLIKPIHPPANFYKKSFKPDWITGAFMLTPRDLFSSLNGFDQNVFMYGEDLELCYRIKKTGKEIIYSDHPTITHLQSKSSSSRFAIVSEVKGIRYFFKKHKPTWQLPIVKLVSSTGSLLRLLLFGIILGDETKKKAYQEALTI